MCVACGLCYVPRVTCSCVRPHACDVCVHEQSAHYSCSRPASTPARFLREAVAAKTGELPSEFRLTAPLRSNPALHTALDAVLLPAVEGMCVCAGWVAGCLVAGWLAGGLHELYISGAFCSRSQPG